MGVTKIKPYKYVRVFFANMCTCYSASYLIKFVWSIWVKFTINIMMMINGVYTFVQGTIVQGVLGPRGQMSKEQLCKKILFRGDFCPKMLLPVISLLKLSLLFSIGFYDIDWLWKDKEIKWSALNVSTFHLGQKSPWTNVSMDKSLPGLMSLGQSGSWTTVPWTNVSTPDYPINLSWLHYYSG